MERKVLYVKILGVSVLAMIALLTVMYVPVMAREDTVNKRLVALKMRGIAFSRSEDVRVRNRVYIHLWMSAKRVNRTVRLCFRNGSIIIGDVTYVFEEGKGVAGRFHCYKKAIVGLLLLKGRAVNSNGEVFNFTMFGRLILLKRRAAYIVGVGFLRGETQGYFLLVEGLIVPVNLRTQ